MYVCLRVCSFTCFRAYVHLYVICLVTSLSSFSLKNIGVEVMHVSITKGIPASDAYTKRFHDRNNEGNLTMNLLLSEGLNGNWVPCLARFML